MDVQRVGKGIPNTSNSDVDLAAKYVNFHEIDKETFIKNQNNESITPIKQKQQNGVENLGFESYESKTTSENFIFNLEKQKFTSSQTTLNLYSKNNLNASEYSVGPNNCIQKDKLTTLDEVTPKTTNFSHQQNTKKLKFCTSNITQVLKQHFFKFYMC